MRICKHCQVRIELINCADGHDRWLHKIGSDVPGMPPTAYLECKLPRPVAEP